MAFVAAVTYIFVKEAALQLLARVLASRARHSIFRNSRCFAPNLVCLSLCAGLAMRAAPTPAFCSSTQITLCLPPSLPVSPLSDRTPLSVSLLHHTCALL